MLLAIKHFHNNQAMSTSCKGISLLHVRQLWWWSVHTNPEKGSFSFYCRETAIFLKKQLGLESSVNVLHDNVEGSLVAVGGVVITVVSGKLGTLYVLEWVARNKWVAICNKMHLETLDRITNQYINATDSQIKGWEKLSLIEQQKLSVILQADLTRYYKLVRVAMNHREEEVQRGDARYTMSERFGRWVHGQTLGICTPPPGQAATMDLHGSSHEARILEGQRDAALPTREKLYVQMTVGGIFRTKDGKQATNLPRLGLIII